MVLVQIAPCFVIQVILEDSCFPKRPGIFALGEKCVWNPSILQVSASSTRQLSKPNRRSDLTLLNIWASFVLRLYCEVLQMEGSWDWKKAAWAFSHPHLHIFPSPTVQTNKGGQVGQVFLMLRLFRVLKDGTCVGGFKHIIRVRGGVNGEFDLFGNGCLANLSFGVCMLLWLDDRRDFFFFFF